MAGAENAHRPGMTIQPSGGPERDELTTVDRYAEVDVELSAVGARVGAGSGPLVVVNGEMREKERRPTIPDDAATCDVPCSGGISLVAAWCLHFGSWPSPRRVADSCTLRISFLNDRFFRFRRAPRPPVDPCGGRRDMTLRMMYKSVKRTRTVCDAYTAL